MRVLVVDDVGYTRLFLERALSKQGHDVLTAGSGAQALEILKASPSIEVVLVDLMMRDMDGVALFENAARLERPADTRTMEPPTFILMTALRPRCNAQQRDLDRMNLARKLGFAEILFKPIELEPLLQLLDTISNQRAGRKVVANKPVNQFRDLVNEMSTTKDPAAARNLLNQVYADLDRLRELADAREPAVTATA